MRDFLVKNYLVVIALALPFLFVIGVAAVVSLQTSSVNTNYNFVYATCDYSITRSACVNLSERYVVNDGIIEIRPMYENFGTTTREVSDVSTRLFMHQMPENISREVALQDLQQYEISTLLQSPDGFEIVGRRHGSQGVFPLFSTPTYHGYYLTNTVGQRKLNLSSQVDERYYFSNFHFVGWIINQ